MDKAGEKDDGGGERVVDQELAEPERCFARVKLSVRYS
jgi:hypothetical protein